jgi:hypothetical protein
MHHETLGTSILLIGSNWSMLLAVPLIYFEGSQHFPLTFNGNLEHPCEHNYTTRNKWIGNHLAIQVKILIISCKVDAIN